MVFHLYSTFYPFTFLGVIQKFEKKKDIGKRLSKELARSELKGNNLDAIEFIKKI